MRFKRFLKNKCAVKDVDEYLTSKLHSRCHRRVEHQCSHRQCKDGEVRVVKVWDVLHCRNSGCSGMTLHRDDNAARNILALLIQDLEDGPRLAAFRRS